jgi:hypothetical protein
MGVRQKAMQPVSGQFNQDHQRGMDNLEEVPQVHGDITNNAGPTTSPGEIERGFTHDSLEIS